MKINSASKISALIKENSKTIDAIVLVNPLFKKLRNPLLRGILASRTTIGDAARIGKCDISVLFKSLSDIGFEIENEPAVKEENIVNNANPEILNAIKLSKVTSLDVRPTLKRGGDPFNEIMGELLKLPKDNVLEVINSFEPTPLIKKAHNEGFASMVETKEDAVYTYFIKVGQAKDEVGTENMIFNISAAEHEAQRDNCNKEVHEIDVRDLEMPMPMVTILKELEVLKENEALYVNHKKIPQYLLPELAERGFRTWIAEIDEYNVKLLIYK